MGYNSLREQLRAARRRQALSQAALAARSGIGRVTIARLEAGSAQDVRTGTVGRLCETLGLELTAVPVGGQPELETLLAREQDRTRRVERRLGHAVLAARLLAIPRPQARALDCEGPRRRRSMGARGPVQPSLHLALAGRARSARGARGAGASGAGRLGRRPVPEHALGLQPAVAPCVKREDLRRLFARARELCGETDYVVLGSLSVLGYAGEVPPRMAASIDVDAYSKSDPGRVFELTPALGLGSAFESEHGYYLDPISPRVATLPAAWEARLVRIELELELCAWFLEPNDAAVSKYARMEPRDREWIRPGLQARSALARNPGRALCPDELLRRGGGRACPQGARRGSAVASRTATPRPLRRRLGRSPAARGGSAPPAWAAFQTYTHSPTNRTADTVCETAMSP